MSAKGCSHHKDCGNDGPWWAELPFRLYLQVLLAFLLIALFVILVVFLVLHPHKPRFYLENATISQLNVSNGFLTSSLQFTVVSHNPNDRIGVIYDRLSSYASYMGQQITSQCPLPPFYQGDNDVDALNPILYGNSVPLDPFVCERLNYEMQNGLVSLSVGDTYPMGCAFDESIVHHEFFKENPDFYNPKYNTKYGVYSENCGLENIIISWGHDEYMHMVAKMNRTTLPPAALFIIRFHSFYALHRAGAYTHLMNDKDHEMLEWVKIFNKYDLYSKSKVRVDVEEVKPYYQSLIDKYFPSKLRW